VIARKQANKVGGANIIKHARGFLNIASAIKIEVRKVSVPNQNKYFNLICQFIF